MKKLLITLGLAVVSFTGCATKALDNNVGGHCVSTNVKVGDTIQGFKVQWLSAGSDGCSGNTPVHAKMVFENEFMHPTVFKRMVENHDGSVIRAVFATRTGLDDVSRNEQQRIITRDCLLGNNHYALGCIPKASSNNDVYVNGYYRKDGTYVQGHYRTRPNGNKTDNYSYEGNINPHTNKVGTQR